MASSVVLKSFLNTGSFMPPITVSSQMSLYRENDSAVCPALAGNWISVKATSQCPGSLYSSGNFTIKLSDVLEGK